jgi:hypothetical protein
MRELTNKDNGGKMWKVSVLGTADEWSDHRFKYVLININDAILWLNANPDFQLPDEACHILKKYPDIKVVQCLPIIHGWHVTIPNVYDKNARTSEELLQYVTEARDELENAQKEQGDNATQPLETADTDPATL